MFSDYIGLPRTPTGPCEEAPQPAPAELQQTPAQSLYRLQPPAPACGMPLRPFWQRDAAPVEQMTCHLKTVQKLCLFKIVPASSVMHENVGFPHLKLSEDRCCVIGDKELLQVVDDHFVHT